MKLTNWGRYPVIETTVVAPRSEKALTSDPATTDRIARGLGRCYGDAALNDHRVVSTQRLGNMLSFDRTSGLLVAEAGVSLAEIVECFSPRGWFVPVTPGTKFVTLGGAVASDVHGKNHHVAATFGLHVAWLDLLTAKDGVVRCSPKEQTDLFRATCGGMGLTGVILRVAVRLSRIPSAWIAQRSIKTRNLAEIMDAFDAYGHYPFSVAWIDCLKGGAEQGRSFLMAGDWAEPAALGKHAAQPFHMPPIHEFGIPCDFPSMALNTLSVKAFNALYYAKAPNGTRDSILPYNTFFYPLDAIHHWNRIYGRRGFTQYQFVVPRAAGKEALPKILSRIRQSGQGSFLAVLKLFGKQPTFRGNLSFPMEGYTLALDFPITKALFPLLDELDAIVLDSGGRHYLTKDVRLSGAAFRRGYGAQLDAFLEIKATYDPHNVFCSRQSKRLGL